RVSTQSTGTAYPSSPAADRVEISAGPWGRVPPQSPAVSVSSRPATNRSTWSSTSASLRVVAQPPFSSALANATKKRSSAAKRHAEATRFPCTSAFSWQRSFAAAFLLAAFSFAAAHLSARVATPSAARTAASRLKVTPTTTTSIRAIPPPKAARYHPVGWQAKQWSPSRSTHPDRVFRPDTGRASVVARMMYSLTPGTWRSERSVSEPAKMVSGRAQLSEKTRRISDVRHLRHGGGRRRDGPPAHERGARAPRPRRRRLGGARRGRRRLPAARDHRRRGRRAAARERDGRRDRGVQRRDL